MIALEGVFWSDCLTLDALQAKGHITIIIIVALLII